MKVLTSFIGGFREGLPQATGLSQLWEQLRQKHSDELVHFHSRFEWKHKAKHIAAGLVKILRTQAPRPRLILVAYSWGGPTCAEVCERLGKAGYAVDSVILCDPVHRASFLPNKVWWLEVRALTRWPKYIWFPQNVQDIHAVYQRENRPHGRMPGVKAFPAQQNGRPAHLRTWLKVEAKHTEIDGSVEFSLLVNEIFDSHLNITEG